MSIAFVKQATPATTAGATSLAVTFSPTNTADLLVFVTWMHTGTTVTVSSVQDNNSTAWTAAGIDGFLSGSNTRVHMAFLPNNGSGITSVTANYSGSVEAIASVVEFSGVTPTSPQDGYNSAGNASGTAQATGTVSPVASNVVIIGAMGSTTSTYTLNQAGSAPTSGWTDLTQGSIGSGNTGHHGAWAYQIFTSAQTNDNVAYTLGTSRAVGWVITGFKAGGAVVQIPTSLAVLQAVNRASNF